MLENGMRIYFASFQYKQKTAPKFFKTEIKIPANHELAQLGFEQPSLVQYRSKIS